MSEVEDAKKIIQEDIERRIREASAAAVITREMILDCLEIEIEENREAVGLDILTDLERREMAERMRVRLKNEAPDKYKEFLKRVGN